MPPIYSQSICSALLCPSCRGRPRSSKSMMRSGGKSLTTEFLPWQPLSHQDRCLVHGVCTERLWPTCKGALEQSRQLTTFFIFGDCPCRALPPLSQSAEGRGVAGSASRAGSLPRPPHLGVRRPRQRVPHVGRSPGREVQLGGCPLSPRSRLASLIGRALVRRSPWPFSLLPCAFRALGADRG